MLNYAHLAIIGTFAGIVAALLMLKSTETKWIYLFQVLKYNLVTILIAASMPNGWEGNKEKIFYCSV
jgi:hypothetical protein